MIRKEQENLTYEIKLISNILNKIIEKYNYCVELCNNSSCQIDDNNLIINCQIQNDSFRNNEIMQDLCAKCLEFDEKFNEFIQKEGK